VRRLIELRRNYPLLHRDRFVHGEEQFEPGGFSDIQWLHSEGRTMQEHDWHDPKHNALGMLLAAGGDKAPRPADGRTRLSALVVVYNADPAPLRFSLPPNERRWRCLLTTADIDPVIDESGRAAIEGRSLQLFELRV
jgi:glycogen operon protein